MTDSATSRSGIERKRTQATERDGEVFVSCRRPGESRDDGVISMDERDATVLLYQLAHKLNVDISQPEFKIPEWEVGVQEADDEETWDFYHPRAPDRRVAYELALEEAREDFDDPVVYCSTAFDIEGDWTPWFSDDYDEFLANKEMIADV